MENVIGLNSTEEARVLFGSHDEHLKMIETRLDVAIITRGEKLLIKGDKASVDEAGCVLQALLTLIRSGQGAHRREVNYALDKVTKGQDLDLHDIYSDRIEVSSKRRYITPKSPGQKAYVDAILEYDIVFGIGPAGTGKTYLAMAMAVSALKKKLVSRIILTRPAIEAGESLGFLPGDLSEKISPYLRPLYDALYDMMEAEAIERLIDRGIIEVAPLAYMRGRTLNDSFVILDEAQNSTTEQMKMFLTRLGFDSKTVITGDVTQVDLPPGRPSGLIQVQEILKSIDGIKFSFFTGEDVVRHELVQKIIKAYQKLDQKKNDKK
ncbi:MAG: PhoH family protein [Candidatus Omnitrophica bacterium]|nr:PhoH family protein [Candidatus Omnitrophota bacterium]